MGDRRPRRLHIGDPGIHTMEKQPKIPVFTYDISTWFTHVEATWYSAALTDADKFQLIVAAIPSDVAALICNLLQQPPEKDKYPAIKAALLQVLGRTRLSYLQQLDALQLDGRRPSALLSHMQALNNASGMPMPELLLRHRHLQLMPADLRLHLAALSETLSLQDYAQKADHLYEVFTHGSTTGPSPSAVSGLHDTPSSPQCNAVTNSSYSSDVSASVLPRSERIGKRPDMPQAASAYEAALEKIVTRLERLETRLNVRNVQPRGSNECYYHRRFGAHARRCQFPCTWQGNGHSGGR